MFECSLEPSARRSFCCNPLSLQQVSQRECGGDVSEMTASPTASGAPSRPRSGPTAAMAASAGLSLRAPAACRPWACQSAATPSTVIGGFNRAPERVASRLPPPSPTAPAAAATRPTPCWPARPTPAAAGPCPAAQHPAPTRAWGWQSRSGPRQFAAGGNAGAGMRLFCDRGAEALSCSACCASRNVVLCGEMTEPSVGWPRRAPRAARPPPPERQQLTVAASARAGTAKKTVMMNTATGSSGVAIAAGLRALVQILYASTYGGPPRVRRAEGAPSSLPDWPRGSGAAGYRI